MLLASVDWIIIAAYFAFSLFIGLWVSRKSGESSSEFFLSGRSMSWWLLGVSMVATTFSADTPNLVTGFVRKDGVAGNWAWWAFLLTGMLTVFMYAKLWRRAGILTDLEFYEMRYSGKIAVFLRGFRALYLGIILNVLIMATVSLAAIKIGNIMLGADPVVTVVVATVITAAYSTFGGFKSVIITDFFQFILAMGGTIWAAIYLVNIPEVGGLTQMLQHPNVVPKLDMIPDFNSDLFFTLILIPIAVQWWSVWYPGAEPGGGGYIAQRMLAAKSEKNAIKATLFFNIAHYALRPWPWILVALASLIVFPELKDIKAQFPNVSDQYIAHDLAYPAMMSLLPAGLIGLLISGLAAAYMSTIATHLNWGSSYVVNDFYKRFVNPEATEKQMVNVGRLSTIFLAVVSSYIALQLKSAQQTFDMLIQFGAGTGLIYILRWFWWRVNAWSEITGMVVSALVAIYFNFIYDGDMSSSMRLISGVAITTIGWLVVTFLTQPTNYQTLLKFYQQIKPAAFGWKPVVDKGLQSGELQKNEVDAGQLPLEFACMILGCFLVYTSLFSVGFWIYGKYTFALILTVMAIASSYGLFRIFGKLRTL
jgi:SSS family transporter